MTGLLADTVPPSMHRAPQLVLHVVKNTKHESCRLLFCICTITSYYKRLL